MMVNVRTIKILVLNCIRLYLVEWYGVGSWFM